MERFLDGWRKADEWLARLERMLIVVAVLVMLGATFAQSLLRVTLEKNLLGANEVATLLLVWVGFLSASLATKERRHIIVDAVPKLLGERKAEQWLSAATALASALFLAYLIEAGWNYLQSSSVQYRTSAALGVPMRYVVVSLPITLVVMVVRFLQLAVEETAVAIGAYPRSKRRTGAGIDEMIQEIQGGKTTAAEDKA